MKPLLQQKFMRLCGWLAMAAALLLPAGCGPTESATEDPNPSVQVERQSFSIRISEIGALEAQESIAVNTPVRHAQAKLISLVPEGTRVEKGDVIAQIDPTPFEERAAEIATSVDEHRTRLEEAEESLALEKIQAEKELLAARHRVMLAELELKDVLEGKGKISLREKKANVDEAKTRYEREAQRHKDIADLFEQDFVSAYELAKQKITMDEAKHAYELAKLKHEVEVNYTYPASKAKAEAELKKVQSDYSSLEKRFQRSLARERAQVENRRSWLKRREQRLAEAEQEVRDCTIKAPADGFIIYGRIWSGSWRKVQVGDQLHHRWTLVEIPKISSIIARIRVREVDVHQVQKGQAATVTIDAFPELEIKGHIETIGTLAHKDRETNTNEKYFTLDVKLDKSDPRFRPGMTARIEILVDEVKDVLAIPIHAVFMEDGEPICYVKTEEGPKRRKIELGRQNEDLVEVTEGLMENEYIYLAQQQRKKQEEEGEEGENEGKKTFGMN